MPVKKKSVKKRVAKKRIAKTRAAKPRKPSVPPKKPKKSRLPKKQVGTCFVLMPFREPFETYYSTTIKPAVFGANLTIKRGDSLFTPTPIMGDVWKMIQEADVLLAELTGKNPNVFYELGLGHALGKPIILVSETMDDVPFDLQQLRVILYDKNDPAWGNKLKNSITTALQETLATPVEAVPPMFRKKVKSQAPSDTETSLRLSSLESSVSSIMRELSQARFGDSRTRDPRSKRIMEKLEDEWNAAAIPSREAAGEWAQKRLARFHRSTIQRFLTARLDDEEASKIIEIALA